MSREDPEEWSSNLIRKYKRLKRQFWNVLYVNEEQELCIRNVYNDIDKAAEVDVRLFLKLTKRRKLRSLRIHPDNRDKEGVIQSNPCGVV